MMAQSSFKSLRNALSICRTKKLSWKQTSTAAFSLLPSATRERSTSSCRATRGCRAHVAQMINVELFVIGVESLHSNRSTINDIALGVQETSVCLWTVNDESFFLRLSWNIQAPSWQDEREQKDRMKNTRWKDQCPKNNILIK